MPRTNNNPDKGQGRIERPIEDHSIDGPGPAMFPSKLRNVQSVNGASVQYRNVVDMDQSPTCGSSPVQPKQIPNAVVALGEARLHIGMLLTILTQRLSPVMRPCAPTGNSNDVSGPKSGCGVDVADAIYDTADGLKEMASHVDDLIQRLEV